MAAVWRGNTYLLVSFPVGIATFVFLVTGISVGVSLAIVWVGLPILVATLAGSRWMARFERRRAAIALRAPIPTSYLAPHRRGMFGWLHTAIGDSATWKDLLWLLILLPVLGLAGFTLAVCTWGTGLGLVLLPAWYWAVGDTGVDLGAVNVDTLDEAWIGIPVGLVVLTITVPLTRGLGIGLAQLGRALLAPSERRRVVELERTRAGAVDSQAAELQRIERDLHDGAQARLVALAMDLGMAQEKLDSDPAGARPLVAGAHTRVRRAQPRGRRCRLTAHGPASPHLHAARLRCRRPHSQLRGLSRRHDRPDRRLQAGLSRVRARRAEPCRPLGAPARNAARPRGADRDPGRVVVAERSAARTARRRGQS